MISNDRTFLDPMERHRELFKSNCLERFDQLVEALHRNESLRHHGEAISALVDHWYPHRPWGLPHEVAFERLQALYVVTYFTEHLASITPELNLPLGFSLKGKVEGFQIIPEDLAIAVSYQITGDSMAPQLMPGTKVLVVKQKVDNWSAVTGVVLINWSGHFNKETLGRIVAISEQSITISRDNTDWPVVSIPYSAVAALYSVRYIVGKTVP